MRRRLSRPLTDGERGLAREVFGSALAVDGVRLLSSPKPFDRAFVPGRWFGRDWIVWPGHSLPDDIAQAPVQVQATLVHELTHVWQAQQGINLLTGKLKAGDAAAAYRYPTDDSCDWCSLNIEQQAMMVEHRFRLSRGGTVPREDDFYRHRVPFFG